MIIVFLVTPVPVRVHTYTEWTAFSGLYSAIAKGRNSEEIIIIIIIIIIDPGT